MTTELDKLGNVVHQLPGKPFSARILVNIFSQHSPEAKITALRSVNCPAFDTESPISVLQYEVEVEDD